MEKESLAGEVYPDMLEIKTQVLLISNISKPLFANIRNILEQRQEHIELIEIVWNPQCKNQLLNVLVYFRNLIISEEFANMLLDSYKLFVLYVQEVIVTEKKFHSEL